MIATLPRVQYHGTGSGPRHAQIHIDITSWGLVRRAVGPFRIQRAWSALGWTVVQCDPAPYLTATKAIHETWEVR